MPPEFAGALARPLLALAVDVTFLCLTVELGAFLAPPVPARGERLPEPTDVELGDEAACGKK